MRLFKHRTSKFGSLLGLIAVTGMLGLFFLELPTFFATPAGKFFSVFWLGAALAVFTGHAMRFRETKRAKLPYPYNLLPQVKKPPRPDQSRRRQQRQRGLS